MKYLLLFSIFLYALILGCSRRSDYCTKQLDPSYKILYSDISGKYVLQLDSSYPIPRLSILNWMPTKSPQYWRTESKKSDYLYYGEAVEINNASQFSDSCELKRRYFKDQEMLQRAATERREKDSIKNVIQNSFK